MKKFETYLNNTGMQFNTAIQYGRIVDNYIDWVKENNLQVGKIKRTRFTDYLLTLEQQGNCSRTIGAKERAIRRYYEFLGTKHNPAKNWLRTKRRKTLPPPALEQTELTGIYERILPKSPVEYRDRCMMGMILFQGLRLSELQELRICDFDFEKGTVFVQGQRRTNSRRIKLESIQVKHLYDYLNKYRKDLLVYRKYETDRFFLSKGTSTKLGNALGRLMKSLMKQYPHIDGFKQIRASVISNWDKKEGIIEAMVKAGHRYLTSTTRYQTTNYEELLEELKTLHPLENMGL